MERKIRGFLCYEDVRNYLAKNVQFIIVYMKKHV